MGTSPAGRSFTSAWAPPNPAVTRLDFGAVARWTTAWARLSWASGRPTNSTARAAASATRRAVGPADEVVEGVVVSLGVLVLEPAVQQRAHRVRRERAEPEQAGPGQQRRVDLEVGVLRGGADEHQEALFDRREEGVLLGLVEP